MSAIFGILRFDGAYVSPRDLERMGNALAHFGPDGRRFAVEAAAGLGHCLMRVNREDLFERQPLQDREAGLTLVADCRIDNRAELAEAFGLSAADIRDMPDSAFILAAYKKWGEDAARHLLGDFAFAVWDGRAKKLVLARDHMGQRYVHYHRGKDFFAFATDIKGLWTLPDVPQQASIDKIGRRLMGGRRAPAPGKTLFDGIEGLPGASVMTIGGDGHAATRRYWEPHADPVHEGRDEAYYVAAYRNVLAEAVDCRLRRLLHPPGLLLSGGYDSAAIAGLSGPALQPSGRKLVAVASVMPADYRGTIRHARRWVEMCARDMPHLDLHCYTREKLDLLSDMERSFLETGMPAGPYTLVNRAMMVIAARAGARLIMDGHGGDYTLNPRGKWILAHLLKTRQVRRFLTELRAHVRLGYGMRATVSEIAEPSMPSLFRSWRRMKRGRMPPWHERAINPAFAERLIADGTVGDVFAADEGMEYDTHAQMDSIIRGVMNAPEPGAAHTAALHGLQLTRPFHDKRVVALALAIPQNLYVKNGRNRHLACAALKDVYPAEFQTRWRKNDDQIPDFQRTVKALEPRLLAEIARMEQSESLTRYVDFAKIRAGLAARGAEDHNSGWEQETQLALSAFTTARYLEWTMRRNFTKA
jgi:asparagine synthase (glutamine-hydrolysing)